MMVMLRDDCNVWPMTIGDSLAARVVLSFSGLFVSTYVTDKVQKNDNKFQNIDFREPIKPCDAIPKVFSYS